MALSLSPILPPPPSSSSLNSQKFHRSSITFRIKPTSSITIRKYRPTVPKSTQESTDTDASEAESGTPKDEGTEANGQLGEDEASKLGAEIKKALLERAEKEGGFFGGVAEEIGEIEWPAFGKVVGTTGVVLGVIAGSSVVLLTVNAVLAELSDRVFAGKGIQDFFS